jgi:hypothetical protein
LGGKGSHTVTPGLRALDLTRGASASRALRNADRIFWKVVLRLQSLDRAILKERD